MFNNVRQKRVAELQNVWKSWGLFWSNCRAAYASKCKTIDR